MRTGVPVYGSGGFTSYSRKQALAMAQDFAEAGVSWFEEPVPSDDLELLRRAF